MLDKYYKLTYCVEVYGEDHHINDGIFELYTELEPSEAIELMQNHAQKFSATTMFYNLLESHEISMEEYVNQKLLEASR